MIGRGTRPHAGKENCIILDHAGNTTRHGFLENERECKLDGVKKSDEKAPAPMKTCMQCYAINPTAAAVCKECGAPFPPQERALTNEDGKLVELTIEPWEARLNALIDVAKRRNYKKGWISRIIVEEFGEEIGESAWKKLRPMRNWFDAEKREAAIAQRPIAHW
jgi:DNA repair protein RadD